MRKKRGMIDEEETVEERLTREAWEETEKLRGRAPGPRSRLTVAKNVRHVFSLKIGAEELDEIVEAAEAEGMSVGAFIREAALARARKLKSGDPAQELRKKVRELAETVDRL